MALGRAVGRRLRWPGWFPDVWGAEEEIERWLLGWTRHPLEGEPNVIDLDQRDAETSGELMSQHGLACA